MLLLWLTAICQASLTTAIGNDNQGHGPVDVPSREFVVPVGRDVALPCHVSGQPEFIEWFHGPERVVPGNPPRKVRITAQGTLRIRAVASSDSGIYRCRTITGFGVEQVSITLTVKPALKNHGKTDSQDLVAPSPTTAHFPGGYSNEKVEVQPKFVTINEGETANLTCAFKWDGIPTFMWMRLDKGDEIDPEMLSRSYPVLASLPPWFFSGKSYTSIPASVFYLMRDDIFISRLHLNSRNDEVNGTYVCWVGTQIGGFFDAAQVTITNETQSKFHPTQQPPISTLPMAVILFVVGVVLVFAWIRLCQSSSQHDRDPYPWYR